MSQQPSQSGQGTSDKDDETRLPPLRSVPGVGKFIPQESSSQPAPLTAQPSPGHDISIIIEDPSRPRATQSFAGSSQRTGAYRCPDCDFVADRPSALEVHRRSHGAATPYKCPYCPKSYKTISNRNRHIKSHSASPILVDAESDPNDKRSHPPPGTGSFSVKRNI